MSQNYLSVAERSVLGIERMNWGIYRMLYLVWLGHSFRAAVFLKTEFSGRSRAEGFSVSQNREIILYYLTTSKANNPMYNFRNLLLTTNRFLRIPATM